MTRTLPAHRTPCRRRPKLFHTPEDGPGARGAALAARIEAARWLCLECPIMIACRDMGRALHETGIWGGETDDEREAAGYPPRTGTRQDRHPCGTAPAAAAHRRHGEPVDPDCLAAERAANRARDDERKRRAPSWPPQLTPGQTRILHALAATGGNRAAAATTLGMQRKSLVKPISDIARRLRTDTNNIIPAARQLGLLPNTPNQERERVAA